MTLMIQAKRQMNVQKITALSLVMVILVSFTSCHFKASTDVYAQGSVVEPTILAHTPIGLVSDIHFTEERDNILPIKPMDISLGEKHMDAERVPPRYMIALTFDDGPSRFTDEILDTLARYNAVATFCVLGNRIAGRIATVERAHADGHEIIGHSWNHANLTRLNDFGVAHQLYYTSRAIGEIVGYPSPVLFRAPYGIVDARVRNIAYNMGYAMLNWSIDTMDWRFRDKYHIYNHIMEHATHGAIVLLHDIYESTAQAMEMVVPALIEMGFELVTATQLLEYVYGEILPGVEYRGLRPGETR